jgi:hypothetical protein
MVLLYNTIFCFAALADRWIVSPPLEWRYEGIQAEQMPYRADVAAERPLAENQGNVYRKDYQHQHVKCHLMRNSVHGQSLHSHNPDECIEDGYYPATLEDAGYLLSEAYFSRPVCNKFHRANGTP